MSTHFRILAEHDRRIIELSLPAQIESIEFDALYASLSKEILAWPGGKWMIDLAAAEYYGSALLGLLVNLRTHVRKVRGKMVLCCIQPPLQRVIDLGNLHRLFVIAPDRSSGLT